MASSTEEPELRRRASDFETDEWDAGKSTWPQHMVAGSLAGVAEHSFMFPIDTMKTIMQVRHAPTAPGGSAITLATVREWGVLPAVARAVEEQGMRRMWRGVQTMFTGCIPAHACYFSIYETCKPAFGRWLVARSPPAAGGSAALPAREAALAAGGAVALGTMAHDLIMTPMDVCKQRLQLGFHKNSVYDCACSIMKQEGARAFVVSYPTTLVMNLPYALVMGATNEALRNAIDPSGQLTVAGYFTAGACAGVVAAAATNPLDVVKTRQQTQNMGASGLPAHCQRAPLAYTGMLDTMAAIWRQEGMRGFTRGIQARMLIHAPSVAICWTTYESIKNLLQKLDYF